LREAHFEVKSEKTVAEHFWTFRCRFAWQAQGIVHLVKREQNVTGLQQFQNFGWDICTRDRDVRGPGADQIFMFGTMIWCDIGCNLLG